MEIAAPMYFDAFSRSLLHLSDLASNGFRIVWVPVVRVRSGHDVGSTGFGCHPQHRQRFFQAVRSIVQARQNMAMNIDQLAYSNLLFVGTAFFAPSRVSARCRVSRASPLDRTNGSTWGTEVRADQRREVVVDEPIEKRAKAPS
jgi:hypothetical protein